MHITDHHDLDKLRALYKRQRDGRTRTRLQAVILARQGESAAAIAKILGYSPRSIQGWVRRYNAHGIEGMADRPRSGRTPKLPRREEAKLRKKIETGLATESGKKLRGRDIQQILKVQFGVDYSLDGVYKLLHRLGYNDLRGHKKQRRGSKQAADSSK